MFVKKVDVNLGKKKKKHIWNCKNDSTHIIIIIVIIVIVPFKIAIQKLSPKMFASSSYFKFSKQYVLHKRWGKILYQFGYLNTEVERNNYFWGLSLLSYCLKSKSVVARLQRQI